jgi:mevalonate pyrophosphate decarboxylase
VFKFKDEYKTRVALRKMRGYPANYVTDFVKDHKKKMLQRAQEMRVRNPESIAWNKWYEKRKKEVDEYQARKAEEDARKAAEKAERAEMQGLNDTIASLCASESLRF